MDFPNLKKSILWNALSSIGKEIFQSPSIFYWSGRAKKEAEINATIGEIAGSEDELIGNKNQEVVTFYVPALKEFTNISPKNIVPYAPVCGLPDLRKYWQEWVISKGKTSKNLPSGQIDLTGKITNPVITPGITFGIFMAVRLFMGPKEFLVSPNKRWPNYDSIAELQCEGKILSFDVFMKNKAFNINGMLEKMEESMKKINKAVIILNFPNNPTGYIPNKEESQKIVNALVGFANDKKKPVVVICDDAYEGYIYNDEGITASLFYELTNRSEYVIPIKLDGASKEMLMYGGRVGALTIGLSDKWFTPETRTAFLDELENKMEAVIRSTVSNSVRLSQQFLVDMFKQGIEKMMNSRQKVIGIVKERYDIINKLLAEVEKEIPTISVDPNAGGFFCLVNLGNKVDASEVNELLLKKYKTGTIPIGDKNSDINALRVAYASIPKEKIPKFVENLKAALKDLKI